MCKQDRAREIRYMYKWAPERITQKCFDIEMACDKYGVRLTSAALQFPLLHPLCCSVIPGAKTAEEAEFLAECLDEQIPAAFWHELKRDGLIRGKAPIPPKEQ